MRRTRGPVLLVAVLSIVLALLMPSSAGASSSGGVVDRGRHLTVGSVTLTRCAVLPGSWCGSLRRAWDPTGGIAGSLAVGFVYRPASDASSPAIGTVVPHEGGPGYSTNGSAPDYAAMYGDLLRHRNMLLVDQRGTGFSSAVRCPTLQRLRGAYAPAAAACAEKLGDKFPLYSSELSADDLSAVISALGLGPVDLYGDSYGTFFAQVFLGRHPDQLRSVVLDSAYPTYGEDAWYDTQTPAMTSSFEKVCARTPSCAALGGSTMGRLTQLLDVVRVKPLRGKATGADGKMHKVSIGPADLAYAAFGATYGPITYREFDAAIRSALAGDSGPMARLVSENNFVGGADDPVDYSEGLDAAVSCQDYPQLYDMSQPPSVRAGQYAAALAAKERTHPDVYGPFSITEYLASGWGEQDWCLQWPTADPPYNATVPVPLGGHYAAVPTLVLSGELDSITTPAEGDLAAAQIPGARHVTVANSFHVTAEDDTDGCGRGILQAFVADPHATLPASALDCARSVPPVRAAPGYPKSFRSNGSGSPAARAATTAALTAVDMMDRWWQSYAGTGTGLHGGTWTSKGSDVVTLRLKGIRLTQDLAVSGKVVWDRYGSTATVSLRLQQVDAHGRVVKGAAVNGSLAGGWDTRAAGARVSLTGRQGGHDVTYRFLAP